MEPSALTIYELESALRITKQDVSARSETQTHGYTPLAYPPGTVGVVLTSYDGDASLNS
jgi:hypothetical protein